MVNFYKTIYKHGFKYIDTSQYSYNFEYFEYDKLQLDYDIISSLVVIHYKYDNKPINYVYLYNSNEIEFDGFILKILRKYKLNKLINGNKI